MRFKAIKVFGLCSFFTLAAHVASAQIQASGAASQVTLFAGTPAGPDYADGTGTSAQLFGPGWLYGDGQHLFFTDGQKIRQLDLTSGSVITLAGAEEFGFADGTGAAARFKRPSGLWLIGSVLYVADGGNSAVRTLDLSTGAVSTLATSVAVASLWSDGVSLYTNGCGLTCLLQIDISTGASTMIAGNGQASILDGTGTNARFNSIEGLWGDATYLYTVDSLRFRTFNRQTGEVKTVAIFNNGVTYGSYWSDGTYLYTGTQNGILKISESDGSFEVIATDKFGQWQTAGIWGDGTNLFVVDAKNRTIDRFSMASGDVSVLAGSPPPARTYQDGVATATHFVSPGAITGDASYLYVLDGTLDRSPGGFVRRISLSTGETRTLDVPIPSSFWSDGTYLYLSYGKSIERMSLATGQRQVIAGSFSAAAGMWGDGTFLYVIDGIPGPCRGIFCAPPITRIIRSINLYTGEITTVSTKPNSFAPLTISGDDRYLYVPEFDVVQRISRTTGEETPLINVDTTAPRGYSISAIWSDGVNLYLTGGGCDVRRINMATAESISLAGEYLTVGSRDGLGSGARFNAPEGIWSDGKNLYVAETGNADIRLLSIPATPQPFAFPSHGGSSVTVQDMPAMKIGYMRVLPDSTGADAAGFAVFSFHQNAVLVSQASVPAIPPMQTGRIYAELSATVRTGIAIANPNTGPVTISFFFTDDKGQDFGVSSMAVSGNGQIARFLDEAPFNLTNRNARSFTFSASLPVAVIALRGLVNERSEFLVTTLPVTSLPYTSNNPLVFPHYAAGGGWMTQVILLNPTDQTLTGTIDGFTDYSIAPRSAFKYMTTGTGSGISTGVMRVLPNGTTPAGLLIFIFHSNGITVTEASIPGSSSGSAFRMYAEPESGIALANNSASSADVTFDLTDLSGQSVGTASASIPANGHLALFLKELEPFSSLPATFQGVLRVSGDSISMIGLRGLYNARGEFLITTTPATAESLPPPNNMIFPHVVEGGGYTTQVVLFSSGSGSSAGTLEFDWRP
jgi:hypothetical protein